MLVYDYVLMKGTAFSRKVLSLAHKNNSLFIGDSAYGMECNTYEFEQAILSIDGDQLNHLVELCQEKSFRMPSGLSREERREWARNNNNPLNSIQLKEKQMSTIKFDPQSRNEYMKLAGKEFDNRINHMIEVEKYLSTKEYKLGQVVEFAVSRLSNHGWYTKWYIGIVISHGIIDGNDGDYYRIYFNGEPTYLRAVYEREIRPLADDVEIPDELKSYDVMWNVGDYRSKILTLQTFK